MSSQSLYRLGGLAAILGLILCFGSYALLGLLAGAVLMLAVFVVALYRLFRDKAPGLSLAALIVAIGGAVVAGMTVLVTGSQTGMLVAAGAWAIYFLPPLVFGFLAYQHRSAGLPRGLAVCGLVGGVFGLINNSLVIIGGGDYANPSLPALAPLIGVTYLLATVPTLVWLVWAGLALLRPGAAPQQQPA